MYVDLRFLMSIQLVPIAYPQSTLCCALGKALACTQVYTVNPGKKNVPLIIMNLMCIEKSLKFMDVN